MEASQGPFYKTYYYVSDKSGSSSGKGISVEQNLVSFEFSEEKKILMIALKTNDRQFYSEIINGMSIEKFEEAKSETLSSGNIVVNYRSTLHPKFSIRVVTSRQSYETETWTHYEITIERI